MNCDFEVLESLEKKDKNERKQNPVAVRPYFNNKYIHLFQHLEIFNVIAIENKKQKENLFYHTFVKLIKLAQNLHSHYVRNHFKIMRISNQYCTHVY